MDYQLLTKEAQGDLLRAHLLQAEADNFVHTLQGAEAEAVLTALPPVPPKGTEDPHAEERDQGARNIAVLAQRATAAEKAAEVVTAKLAEIGEPVIKPEPKDEPAGEPTPVVEVAPPAKAAPSP